MKEESLSGLFHILIDRRALVKTQVGVRGPVSRCPRPPPSSPRTTASLIRSLWAFSPLGDIYVALWSSQRHLQSSASALKIPSPFSSSVRHLYSGEEFNYANAHTLHDGGRHTMVGMAFLQHGEQSSGYLDCETSPLSSHRSSAAIIRSFSQSLIVFFIFFFNQFKRTVLSRWHV